MVADQEEKGLQRLGDHAQMQRIPRTCHEYPGIVIATHGTGVREDLMTRPGESWIWHRHKGLSSSPLWSFANFALGHRDGHRSPRRGQNRRIRTPARATLSDLRDARVCSKGQLLGLSVGRPPRPQRSSYGTGMRPRSGQQKLQLMKPTGKAQLKGKSEHLSDNGDSVQKQIRAAVRQAIQVKQQGQERKGAKAQKGGANLDRVVIFMMLAQLAPATVQSSSRDIKVDGPRFLHWCPLFPEEQSLRNLSARRSRQLVPVTLESGVGMPRRRARCDHLEARAGHCRPYIVLSRTAQQWRSVPACTQRSICPGAAFASRLDPLAFSGDERG